MEIWDDFQGIPGSLGLEKAEHLALCQLSSRGTGRQSRGEAEAAACAWCSSRQV